MTGRPTWPGAVRALLAATGQSQPVLAAALGVSLSVLEKWLSGARTPAGLYRKALAAALGDRGIPHPD